MTWAFKMAVVALLLFYGQQKRISYESMGFLRKIYSFSTRTTAAAAVCIGHPNFHHMNHSFHKILSSMIYCPNTGFLWVYLVY